MSATQQKRGREGHERARTGGTGARKLLVRRLARTLSTSIGVLMPLPRFCAHVVSKAALKAGTDCAASDWGVQTWDKGLPALIEGGKK
jgi:hypothetical protein